MSPGPEVQGGLSQALVGLGRLVSWVRGLGPLAGAALALIGVALLTAADRLRRPTAALGAAAVGALAAQAAAPILPGALSLTGWTLILAALCGGAAGLAPVAFPSLTGALVGALLGVRLAIGGQPAVGGIVAAAIGAALLAISARNAAVVLACLGGGLAVAVGLVALAGGHDLAAQLAARPFVLLGFAVVIGVAGAAFQLGGEKGRSRLPEPPRLPRE